MSVRDGELILSTLKVHIHLIPKVRVSLIPGDAVEWLCTEG
jgi:hypothetical protein